MIGFCAWVWFMGLIVATLVETRKHELGRGGAVVVSIWKVLLWPLVLLAHVPGWVRWFVVQTWVHVVVLVPLWRPDPGTRLREECVRLRVRLENLKQELKKQRNDAQ